MSSVNDVVVALGTRLVATANESGTVFATSSMADSILVIRPPYTSSSWIGMPLLGLHEAPTCISADTDTIYLGTTHGVYKAGLGTLDVDVVVPSNLRVGIRVSPNPAQGRATIHIANYTGDSRQFLGLYSIDGSLVREYNPSLVSELFDVSIDLSGITSGPYLLVFKAGGATRSTLMIIFS